MSARVELLGTADGREWTAVLAAVTGHDVYHLPQYHEIAESLGEGVARLAVYRESGHTIAVPLLLRSCPAVDGEADPRHIDATSVYGYAGPVASREPPDRVVDGFREGLRDALGDLGVVAVFSRLHPLLPQSRFLRGLGSVEPTGTTVSIDLTLPVDVQAGQFRENHRSDLRSLRAMGVCCAPEPPETALDDFVRIYLQTMRRVGASPYYLFDHEYFARLVRLLPSHTHLFACRLHGEVISAGLFFACDGIVQYHLGGTRDDSVRLAPAKLMFDTVRLWATERGMDVLHLGGGLGGREDSLFHFKAGFSSRRHEYATWRWVVDRGAYDRLAEAARARNAALGLAPTDPAHFPEYRSPTAPAGTSGATGTRGPTVEEGAAARTPFRG